MRYLPIFFNVKTGPVVVVGGGEFARARLRLLTAAGASIRFFATDGDHALAGFSADERARIAIVADDPLGADLTGVIAVFCAGAGDLGMAMAARARSRGIPVNVMDDLAHSSFIVPAIVDRGDVVVAVGTGGASPVIARRIREQIEALLPGRIGDLAALIGRWRNAIKARVPDFPQRRRFWERVIDGPIGASALAGRAHEAEQSLKAIAEGAAAADERGGHVYIVGAGPGDPDLLTLKALRALSDADVIYHDELVSPAVLGRARRDAPRLAVGRRVGQPGIGQDAINALLVEAAREGKRVVRLKGGDPFIFGRGGEEVEALRAAGVSYTIIPGITAGLGAAAEFETPLTYRREALRITFLTAHKASDAETVDWSALTDEKMTVVVYMGMTAAPAIRAGLLAAGRAATTPVGVFARVTRRDSQAALGTLDQLPALVDRVEGGPAILIIGDVVAHARGAAQPAFAHLVPFVQAAE